MAGRLSCRVAFQFDAQRKDLLHVVVGPAGHAHTVMRLERNQLLQKIEPELKAAGPIASHDSSTNGLINDYKARK